MCECVLVETCSLSYVVTIFNLSGIKQKDLMLSFVGVVYILGFDWFDGCAFCVLFFGYRIHFIKIRDSEKIFWQRMPKKVFLFEQLKTDVVLHI